MTGWSVSGWRRRSRERTSGERGDALVEVMAAVTLLSLTSATLFTALATASRVAGRERSQVLVDEVLRERAEFVVAAARTCRPGTALVTEPEVSSSASSGAAPSTIQVSVADADGGAPRCPAEGEVAELRLSAVAADGAAGRTEVVVSSPPVIE